MSDHAFPPSYLRLLDQGELSRRAELAREHLTSCDLCAHHCQVDRTSGVQGVCCTGERAAVHGFGPHHGEEDCLRGWNGSGTVFFSRCNLGCLFCQNWETSQRAQGRETEPAELAAMWLFLQDKGCHNLNLVSPSHVVAQILAALEIAAGMGLHLPIVYNTGGYDCLEALALLDGVVDIYMPDMKYGDSETARMYSGAPGYWEVNQAAVREMHRQVGDLVLDDRGLAQRGLLVRHLVLPGEISGTEEVLTFLAREISTDTYLNLMDQYRPCYRAREYPPLDRPVTELEFNRAKRIAEAVGLTRVV